MKNLEVFSPAAPSFIEEVFSALSRHNPRPQIELDYHSPYTLLVAVILSAQSTDVQVNKVTPNLFAAADNPERMVALGEAAVKDKIRSLGLYNNKAKNIIAMSAMLVDKFNSQVPNSLKDLMQLPGVGSKSARVILNVVFGQATIAVDTHAFRVANRLGLCKTKTATATEEVLECIIPMPWRKEAHHWLVLHGRHICKAIKPRCDGCPLVALCPYHRQLTT